MKKCHFFLLPLRKILTVLAQFGTCVAAIVALFALREAISQRESMYKPELFVESSYIFADFTDPKEIKFYTADRDSLTQKESILFPIYHLVNVGFGAALRANIYWYLTPTVVETYFKANGIAGVKITKEGNVNKYQLGEDEFIIINDGTIAGWPVNYVMPINSKEEICRGYCEQIIGRTLSVLMKWQYKYSSGGTVYDSMLRIPATLKYSDINGKWFTKRLEIDVFPLKYIPNNGVVYGIYPQKNEEEISREFREMGGV